MIVRFYNDGRVVRTEGEPRGERLLVLVPTPMEADHFPAWPNRGPLQTYTEDVFELKMARWGGRTFSFYVEGAEAARRAHDSLDLVSEFARFAAGLRNPGWPE